MTDKPLHHCSICSQLPEVAYGFYSVMPDGDFKPLPQAANQLVAVEPLDTYDQKKHHAKQCPQCGLYYQYDEVYEYDVTGSTDDLTLTRLTWTEAYQRSLIDAKTHQQQVHYQETALHSAEEITRAYAAKCLAAYHLAQGTVQEFVPVITNGDEAVLLAVLRYLNNRLETWWLEDNRHLILEIAKAAREHAGQYQALTDQIIRRCGLQG